jgi:hypothetical protein
MDKKLLLNLKITNFVLVYLLIITILFFYKELTRVEYIIYEYFIIPGVTFEIWYNAKMDYIIGFLLGFFLKDIGIFIKRISNYDWENRNYFDKAYTWSDDIYMSEDDLP